MHLYARVVPQQSGRASTANAARGQPVLEVQASTDGLTGFANRRCFDEVFEAEWKRHERIQLPLSVAMIDIDFFKQLNDEKGHLEGDLCLKSVADKIRDGVRRPGDFWPAMVVKNS